MEDRVESDTDVGLIKDDVLGRRARDQTAEKAISSELMPARPVRRRTVRANDEVGMVSSAQTVPPAYQISASVQESKEVRQQEVGVSKVQQGAARPETQDEPGPGHQGRRRKRNRRKRNRSATLRTGASGGITIQGTEELRSIEHEEQGTEIENIEADVNEMDEMERADRRTTRRGLRGARARMRYEETRQPVVEIRDDIDPSYKPLTEMVKANASRTTDQRDPSSACSVLDRLIEDEESGLFSCDNILVQGTFYMIPPRDDFFVYRCHGELLWPRGFLQSDCHRILIFTPGLFWRLMWDSTYYSAQIDGIRQASEDSRKQPHCHDILIKHGLACGVCREAWSESVIHGIHKFAESEYNAVFLDNMRMVIQKAWPPLSQLRPMPIGMSSYTSLPLVAEQCASMESWGRFIPKHESGQAMEPEASLEMGVMDNATAPAQAQPIARAQWTCAFCVAVNPFNARTCQTCTVAPAWVDEPAPNCPNVSNQYHTCSRFCYDTWSEPMTQVTERKVREQKVREEVTEDSKSDQVPSSGSIPISLRCWSYYCKAHSDRPEMGCTLLETVRNPREWDRSYSILEAQEMEPTDGTLIGDRSYQRALEAQVLESTDDILIESMVHMGLGSHLEESDDDESSDGADDGWRWD